MGKRRFASATFAIALSALIGFAMPMGDAAIAQAPALVPQSVLSAQPSQSTPVKAANALSRIVSGSLDPAAGSTEGGTFTTVTLDEAPSVTSVAAGDDFALGLTDDGLVAAWGEGSAGQLGDGLGEASLTPVLLSASVFDNEPVVQLAAGATTAYAVTDQGTVYAWGDGGEGQLGAGAQNAVVPIALDRASFGGEPVVQIAAAAGSTAALARTESGAVYAWGTGLAPTQLTLPESDPANRVSVGDSGAIAVLTVSGTVLVGALDSQGTTLIPVDTAALDGVPAELGVTGADITVLTVAGSVFTRGVNGDFAAVADINGASELAVGGNFNVALAGQTDAVEVFSWSGVGDDLATVDLAALDGATVTGATVGANAGYLIADGAVYAWGAGSSGRLGIGADADQATPVLSANFRAVAVDFGGTPGGGITSFEPTSVGVVTPVHDAGAVDLVVTYALGAGTDTEVQAAQQGNQPATTVARVLEQAFTFEEPAADQSPMQMRGLGNIQPFSVGDVEPVLGTSSPSSGSTAGGTATSTEFTVGAPVFIDTTAGSFFALGLTADGKVYAWGNGQNGRLGNGGTTDSVVPVIVGIPDGKSIVQIAAGHATGYALAFDGTVYAWGAGSLGQRGDTTTTGSVSTPVLVSNLAGATYIAAGHSSAYAVSDGKAFAWGKGDKGQLGVGDNTNHTLPVAVSATGASTLSGKTVIAIAGGEQSGYALDGGGEVHAWGAGDQGQLGNGTNAAIQNTPIAVNTAGVLSGKTIRQIWASEANAYALDTDGKAYAWGSDGEGQLGDNTTLADKNLPVAVDTTGVLSGKTITQIVAGGTSASVLDSDGKAYSWGNNANGQLGIGDTADHSTPVAVSAGVIPGGVAIASLASSNSSTYAVAADGKTYAWGSQTDGALGNSSTSGFIATPVLGANFRASAVQFGGVNATGVSYDVNTGVISATTPAHAQGAVPISVQYSIFAGSTIGAGAATLTVPSSPFTFELPPVIGSLSPASGPQMGNTATITTITSGAPMFVEAAAGSGFAIGLTADGKVYSWGLGTSGQLGNGSTINSSVPVAVSGGTLAGKTVTQIAAGMSSGYALASDGTVHAWGVGTDGRLGDGASAQRTSPVQVSTLTGVTHIAAGGSSAYAVSGGNAYAWGLGTNGQIGDGSSASRTSPTAVSATGLSTLTGKTVVAVAGGDTTGYALDATGAVHSWGVGASGQLGNGTTTAAQNTPVAVSTVGVLAGKTLKQITAGATSAYALDTAGKVYAWGSQSDGRLGNGQATGQANAPVSVNAGSIGANGVITRIDAGEASTYALTVDGKAHAWGNGGNGRLGNSSTGNQTSPGAVAAGVVPSGASLTTIAGGASAGYAIASDGKVYSWGNPANGALGNNVMSGTFYSPVLGPNARVTSTPASAVTFGGTNATGVSQTGTQVAATTPAHAPGTVNVVFTPTIQGGTSTTGASTAAPLTLYSAFSFTPTAAPPVGVWHEGFENGGANQSWTNGLSTTDTGRISVYKGASPNNGVPTVGSTWGNIEQCVGIRVYYDKTWPNSANGNNSGYCGQIIGREFTWGGWTYPREQWWNVSRLMAKALGGGSQTNNVASYITNSNVAQSGVGTPSQTPIYQTSSMDMVSFAPSGWANTEVQSRFYTGSIDVAAVDPGNNNPGIGMRLFSNGATGGDQSVELFPTRINVATGSSVYNTGQPSPWPSGIAAVRVGSYSSAETGLFTKAQMQKIFAKATNDNGNASENDFAVDNLRLTDVTPSLYKSYSPDRVQYSAAGTNTSTLTFTVLNTTEQLKKEGWGFIENLPSGLTVAANPTISNSCGATVTASPGAGTITVANGKLNSATSLVSCTISVNVKAASPAVYTSAVSGSTALKGLNAPAAATVEFYELKASKGAAVASTPIAKGGVVNQGDTVDYTLTFDNTHNTRDGVITSNTSHQNFAANPYLDLLGDLLDDADLLGAGGVINNNTPLIANSGWSGAPVISYSKSLKRITITGTVGAGQTATMNFSVKVKDNAEKALERQGFPNILVNPHQYGYRLNNYLVQEASPLPVLSSCVATDIACTHNPISAWTVQKDSQPQDGAAVHSGANNYYRVKVSTLSGEPITGITLKDDLTSTLFAGRIDLNAPPAVKVPWGISFYDSSNNHIATADIPWSKTDGSTVGTIVQPKLTYSDSTAFNPDFPNVNLPNFPNGEPFSGTWTLNVPSFDVPAEASYAIVGYAVKIGQIADPVTPGGSQPGTEVFERSPGVKVNAAPNAFWVNTAAASTATIGGKTIEPNRCRISDLGSGAMQTGWNENLTEDDNFGDCKTYHMLDESFFHFWKQSTAQNPAKPGQVEDNLVGSSFVLSDTKADAVAPGGPVPSQWLCRANNNPGTLASPNSAWVAPGSAPASSGAEDFDFGSTTHAAIVAWNNGLDAWNATQGNPHRDPVETCGLFYRHTGGADADGQPAGSWHAQDIRGGDEATTNGNWRENSAFNNGTNDSNGRHGTYWITETASPANHQLLSQPMKLWVAPITPTPDHLGIGNWDWYNYQGRLSMPVVGEGETADPGWGYHPAPPAEGPSIREMCVSPWVLPAHSQPNCVMPTGWTMPIFDARLKPLPLTGGIGVGWLVGGGATVFALILGAAWWRRRKQALQAKQTSQNVSD